MPLLSQYDTPAYVQDFPSNPEKQKQMGALWNGNVNRWVNAALIGDVWDLENYGPRPAFYNPLVTDTPTGAAVQSIPWNAFPGRIQALFPQNSDSWFEWADNGNLPQMTTDLCTNKPIAPTAYTPTGPRGWQDEYCEWSVKRDPQTGKITSVMFTCENPEYWFTLWQVDPETVLLRYQQLLGNTTVTLDDLVLRDASGTPVIDPSTGKPAYNPLNKWNWGTETLPTQGGAIHLTSSPNTLWAEFDLAAAATIPRQLPPGALLVCCAKFGRVGRHSDPTIGQTVNTIINGSGLKGAMATLTNPPGLYMQMPDFSRFKTPDGTPASQFWTIVRGQQKQNPNDIDRILHAVFEVPANGKYNYTVGDILVDGKAIDYGSQIAQTFNMALSATAYESGKPNQTPVSCTTSNDNPYPAASALQGMEVFTAYRQQETVANEIPLSLPILSLPVPSGGSLSNVALLLNTSEAPENASVIVTESDGSESKTVSVSVTGKATIQEGMDVLLVTITATSDAVEGDRGLLVTVPGQPVSKQPALGLLNIVPASAGPVKRVALRPRHRAGRS